MVPIRDLETNCPLSTHGMETNCPLSTHDMETNALYPSGFGKTNTTPSFAPLELRFRYQVIPLAAPLQDYKLREKLMRMWCSYVRPFNVRIASRWKFVCASGLDPTTMNRWIFGMQQLSVNTSHCIIAVLNDVSFFPFFFLLSGVGGGVFFFGGGGKNFWGWGGGLGFFYFFIWFF